MDGHLVSAIEIVRLVRRDGGDELRLLSARKVYLLTYAEAVRQLVSRSIALLTSPQLVSQVKWLPLGMLLRRLLLPA